MRFTGSTCRLGLHGTCFMVDRRLTLTRINDKILTVVAITFRVCEKLYTPVISELCQHTAIPTMALSLLPNGFRESIRFPHGSSPLVAAEPEKSEAEEPVVLSAPQLRLVASYLLGAASRVLLRVVRNR